LTGMFTCCNVALDTLKAAAIIWPAEHPDGTRLGKGTVW
jgi:hypothetical protein